VRTSRSGPVTFRGQATVFEATVLVTLLDASGAVLEEGFVTATTGAPERGTWEWTVTVPGRGSTRSSPRSRTRRTARDGHRSSPRGPSAPAAPSDDVDRGDGRTDGARPACCSVADLRAPDRAPGPALADTTAIRWSRPPSGSQAASASSRRTGADRGERRDDARRFLDTVELLPPRRRHRRRERARIRRVPVRARRGAAVLAGGGARRAGHRRAHLRVAIRPARDVP
jgi:hypothetical protein